MPPQRRDLSFVGLDEVVRDVELLQEKGYDKAGNWDLAQVCEHLTKWMSFPLEGFPRLGCMAPLLWLMKVTIGSAAKRKILESGKMTPGSQTIRETIPVAGGDETAAIARLKEMVERFKRHSGDLHPSPLFGRMDKSEWTRLQRIHCAHHLSFLIPKAN